jgi:hypothetical protein
MTKTVAVVASSASRRAPRWAAMLQHQLRGNLPQAFVHALLLETAVVLGDMTG